VCADCAGREHGSLLQNTERSTVRCRSGVLATDCAACHAYDACK